jgi:cytochrome c oxidase subunit 2
MNFSVVVLPPDQFNTWVSGQQQAAASPTSSLAQQGLSIFKGSGACAGCHGIVGVNLNSFSDPKASALVGPNLTHFGSRHLIAGGVLEWGRPGDTSCDIVNGKVKDPNNCGLYQWLLDTQKYKPGNDMVVNLTPSQITALIAYLETLK